MEAMAVMREGNSSGTHLSWKEWVMGVQRGESGTHGNGFKDDDGGVPVDLGDYLECAGRRANEVQGRGVGETGAVQIPRGESDAWGEVLEAVDTRSGSGKQEVAVVRPPGIATVRIERTGGLAIGVLAEEPHVVAVGDEILVDVVGEIDALVDDHADRRRR